MPSSIVFKYPNSTTETVLVSSVLKAYPPATLITEVYLQPSKGSGRQAGVHRVVVVVGGEWRGGQRERGGKGL